MRGRPAERRGALQREAERWPAPGRPSPCRRRRRLPAWSWRRRPAGRLCDLGAGGRRDGRASAARSGRRRCRWPSSSSTGLGRALGVDRRRAAARRVAASHASSAAPSRPAVVLRGDADGVAPAGRRRGRLGAGQRSPRRASLSRPLLDARRRRRRAPWSGAVVSAVSVCAAARAGRRSLEAGVVDGHGLAVADDLRVAGVGLQLEPEAAVVGRATAGRSRRTGAASCRAARRRRRRWLVNAIRAVTPVARPARRPRRRAPARAAWAVAWRSTPACRRRPRPRRRRRDQRGQDREQSGAGCSRMKLTRASGRSSRSGVPLGADGLYPATLRGA